MPMHNNTDSLHLRSRSGSGTQNGAINKRRTWASGSRRSRPQHENGAQKQMMEHNSMIARQTDGRLWSSDAFVLNHLRSALHMEKDALRPQVGLHKLSSCAVAIPD